MVQRSLLASSVIRRMLNDNSPSEDAVKKEYETATAAMKGKEYKASHILVDSEDKAKEVIAELKKGGNFAELAKAKSSDSSAGNGGDLGWFSPSMMVPPFAQAVTKMEKGKHSEAPVQTSFGWHVIQLEDVRDATPPTMEELKPQITQMLQSRMVNDYLEKLKAGAKVEVKEIQVSEAKPRKSRSARPSRRPRPRPPPMMKRRKIKSKADRFFIRAPPPQRERAWPANTLSSPASSSQQPRLIQHRHPQFPRLVQFGTRIAARDHIIGFFGYAARHLGPQRPQSRGRFIAAQRFQTARQHHGFTGERAIRRSGLRRLGPDDAGRAQPGDELLIERLAKKSLNGRRRNGSDIRDLLKARGLRDHQRVQRAKVLRQGRCRGLADAADAQRVQQSRQAGALSPLQGVDQLAGGFRTHALQLGHRRRVERE